MKTKSWWEEDKGEVHECVSKLVDKLSDQSRAAREDNRFFLDLVSNGNTAGNDLNFGLSQVALFGRVANKIRFNISRAAVDTAASLIAQNRTAPIYTTTMGDFGLSRKAEMRSRVLQGQFYDLGAYEIGADVFYDGASTGLGGVYGYVEVDKDGKPSPKIERFLPNELLVDDSDGRYREPRSIYRIRFVAKEVAKAMAPNKRIAEEIEKSAGPSDRDHAELYIRKDPEVERVRIVEAWHLPSRKGAKDGRYVACTDKIALVDKPYERDRFPFAFYRYSNRAIGFFGQGLVERVCPAQIRLNEIAAAKKALQDLCSNTVCMVEENSNVEWEDLTNMPGQQITYRQTPPQWMTYTGTPPDLTAEERQIKEEVFLAEGISEQTAGGDKPVGLSSGKAVRAADDVMSRRLIQATRMFEDFYLQLAQLIVDLNDECAEIDPQYLAKARKRNGRKTFLQAIPWKDMQFSDSDDYQVTMFPMSALPTTPAARMQQVEEMIASGFVSRPQALDLMMFPDVEAFASLETVDVDLVEYQIDRILDGMQELPIPTQDLKVATKLMTAAYNRAYMMEAPDEILQLFESYLAYAKTLAPAPAPVLDPAALDPNAAAAAQIAATQGGGAPMPQGPAPGMMQ